MLDNERCVCGSSSCDGTCESGARRRRDQADHVAYMEYLGNKALVHELTGYEHEHCSHCNVWYPADHDVCPLCKPDLDAAEKEAVEKGFLPDFPPSSIYIKLYLMMEGTSYYSPAPYRFDTPEQGKKLLDMMIWSSAGRVLKAKLKYLLEGGEELDEEIYDYYRDTEGIPF